MPSLHLAEARTAAGGRAHVCELTWSAPGMGGALGACHGLDVPLVFGNLERGLPAALIGERPFPEAEEVSARMRRAWTAFAAHGDPGRPAYDSGRRFVQLFDTRPAVTTYPEEASRLIWQDHTFPALPLLGQGLSFGSGPGRKDAPYRRSSASWTTRPSRRTRRSGASFS